MSRAKKLLLVGLVLAIGFGLAWPFRKTGSDTQSNLAVSSMGGSPGSLETDAAVSSLYSPALVGAPQPHVVAKMASTAEPERAASGPPPEASFDLANHPALAGQLPPSEVSPVTPQVPPQEFQPAEVYRPAQLKSVPVQRDPSLPRPVYKTDNPGPLEGEQQDEVRHVVQNSDTLEKLAERYLGDASRALEIFDLNRDLLDNPHLLPIDAELRIPSGATRFVD